MNIFLSLPLVVAICLSSCAGGAQSENDPGTKAPWTPDGYKGPAVNVAFDAGEFNVSIQVPTGGFRLELRETARVDTHTDVKLRLTAPAEDEGVTQVLELKVVKVALAPEPGPIHVQLQEMQRGVEYFVEPEFQLAKIVPR